MKRNTRIYPDPEGPIRINPFEGSDLEVRLKIVYKKNKAKPFPHDMQTDNKKLLQDKYYHSFDGDAAIYVKNEEYIRFRHLLFNLTYENKSSQLKYIGYRIMLCNPDFTEDQLFDCLHHIAVNYIRIPEDKQGITDYIEKIGYTEFERRNLNRIKEGVSQVFNEPFTDKLKRKNQIIYNPDYDLTPEEIVIVRNELLGKIRTSTTLNKIYNTLLNWNHKNDGKPTQKNVKEKIGKISLRTIKSYWHEAKEMVELNNVPVTAYI